MDVIESDIAELVSHFLSCFGVGFAIGYILRSFRRGADSVR